MNPVVKAVTVLVMIIGTGAGVVIVAQAYPLWRRAKGSTRRLLRDIVLLGFYLIGSRLFWQGLILIPETYRQEGTAGYPVVLGFFWGFDILLAAIALRVWKDLRRTNG